MTLFREYLEWTINNVVDDPPVEQPDNVKSHGRGRTGYVDVNAPMMTRNTYVAPIIEEEEEDVQMVEPTPVVEEIEHVEEVEVVEEVIENVVVPVEEVVEIVLEKQEDCEPEADNNDKIMSPPTISVRTADCITENMSQELKPIVTYSDENDVPILPATVEEIVEVIQSTHDTDRPVICSMNMGQQRVRPNEGPTIYDEIKKNL